MLVTCISTKNNFSSVNSDLKLSHSWKKKNSHVQITEQRPEKVFCFLFPSLDVIVKSGQIIVNLNHIYSNA